MAWRIFCGLVGVLAGAAGVAALVYALTPAFRLEPRPGFAIAMAVVALLIAARFLWWAFAPSPKGE